MIGPTAFYSPVTPRPETKRCFSWKIVACVSVFAFILLGTTSISYQYNEEQNQQPTSPIDDPKIDSRQEALDVAYEVLQEKALDQPDATKEASHKQFLDIVEDFDLILDDLFDIADLIDDNDTYETFKKIRNMVLAELEVDNEKFEIAKQESSENEEDFDMYQKEEIDVEIDSINDAFAKIREDVNALSTPPSADEGEAKSDKAIDGEHDELNQRLMQLPQDESNETDFLDLQEDFDLIIDDLFDVEDMIDENADVALFKKIAKVVLEKLEVDEMKFDEAKKQKEENQHKYDALDVRELENSVETINEVFEEIQEDVAKLDPTITVVEIETSMEENDESFEENKPHQYVPDVEHTEFLDIMEDFDLVLDDLIEIQEMLDDNDDKQKFDRVKKIVLGQLQMDEGKFNLAKEEKKENESRFGKYDILELNQAVADVDSVIEEIEDRIAALEN
jgi:hypothetical protein